MRRVNAALGGRLQFPSYGRIVKDLYANRALTQTAESPPPVLPENLWAKADRISEQWIQHITAQNYHVCGDLADLRPRHREGALPNTVSEADVAQAATEATANLLLELTQLTRPREMLRRVARDSAAQSLSQVQKTTHQIHARLRHPRV